MNLTRLSSKITNNMQDVISLKSNKKEFIKFLNEVLNIKILEINFIKILKFDFVSEYGFLLYKYKVKTIENDEIQIYIKLIKNNRIKQSVFCYWSQIYEEEIEEKEAELSINRIAIKEKEINEFKRSIFLEMENNNTEILKNGTQIYLINLLKYMKNIKETIEVFPNKLEEDDIVLIGIKNN